MARIWAGDTGACGSIPPRRSAAIFGESLVSFVAFPPWRAFMERACPRTKGRPSSAQRSASQYPGEQALDGDDNPRSIRGHGFQERPPGRFLMTVHQDLLDLVEDAGVHRPGVPVDAAVKWVLSGVKSHEVSSFLVNRFSLISIPRWSAGEGASISIKAFVPTMAQRPLRSRRWRRLI